jgi:predicted nucleotidyltransferase
MLPARPEYGNLIHTIVDTKAMAAYLARQPAVVAAYLFGSVAHGRADRLSDVDIAVLFDERLGAEESVERQLRFMGDLEVYADREVQVVILNQAPPLLAYQVVRHGILLYERGRTERIAFEVRTRKVYFDLKPMLDFHTQALFKNIKEVGLSGRRKRRSGALEAARRVHQRLTRTEEYQP